MVSSHPRWGPRVLGSRAELYKHNNNNLQRYKRLNLADASNQATNANKKRAICSFFDSLCPPLLLFWYSLAFLRKLLLARRLFKSGVWAMFIFSSPPSSFQSPESLSSLLLSVLKRLHKKEMPSRPVDLSFHALSLSLLETAATTANR